MGDNVSYQGVPGGTIYTWGYNIYQGVQYIPGGTIYHHNGVKVFVEKWVIYFMQMGIGP